MFTLLVIKYEEIKPAMLATGEVDIDDTCQADGQGDDQWVLEGGEDDEDDPGKDGEAEGQPAREEQGNQASGAIGEDDREVMANDLFLLV